MGSLISCKSSTEPSPNYNYFPLTKGSNWHYYGDVAFARTVTGDTIVGGKTYAIIEQTGYSPGRNYYRKDGNIIYSLLPDTMNILRDVVYINPANGASGAYSTLTFKGASEKIVTNVRWADTKQHFRDTTYGKPYADVMIVHIRSVVQYHDTSFSITEGDYYYADGVGMVDQITSGGGTAELTNYEIK